MPRAGPQSGSTPFGDGEPGSFAPQTEDVSAPPSSDASFRGTPRFQPRGGLGRGGMGIVYRVHDTEMRRDIALKTLPSVDPHELFHLKEEFRALAGIAHPNLIELYELVLDGPLCFFTMELLDGTDFLSFVRGKEARRARVEPSGPWIDRLEAALEQLAEGVSAIHQAGKLHRDIKPSNVQVTSVGRVVLLDFGLAVTREQALEGPSFAGTPAYMAPEQLWGKALSPASDWYQVGVMLYEALTGQSPFPTAFVEMSDRKQRRAVSPPSALGSGAPPRFDALVMELLDPDPDSRADGQRVLAHLRPSAEPRAPIDGAAASPFVGRAREVQTLLEALDDCAAGRLSVVRIEGPSGMGKTELVRRFLDPLTRGGRALVLRGRCHPEESVPYKAFDGLIDELSRHLVAIPARDLAALAPPHLGALVRMFPVMGRVEAFAPARAHAADIEPAELRRRGFEALGGILNNLARQQPLVLWVDDLQWGDAESAALLMELLRTLAGSVLLLLAHRSEDAGSNALLQQLAALAGARVVRLDPLDGAEVRALAASLLATSEGADEVQEIAAESAGSPLFVDQLARLARSSRLVAGERGAPRRFAEVMTARVARLSTDERRLLGIVSTAGGPLDRSVALDAAGIGERGRPDVARLSRGKLLRMTEIDGRTAIETYHHKIRESLLAALAIDERRACHRQLVSALLARPNPDAEALATHLLGAGDTQAAAVHLVEGARRAALALAFERASQLYRQALELGAPDRATLAAALAECLVNAGRGSEATRYFLEAAALRAGDPIAARSLRRQAAEQLLRNGHVDEAIAIFRELLGEVGFSLPASNGEALRRTAASFARLVLRGTGFRARSEAEIAPAELHRLDAIWGACSVSMMNATLGSVLGLAHLLEALDAGEPLRIGYGLGYQAVLESAIGGPFFRRRVAAHLAVASRCTQRDPTARGFTWYARGAAAWHGGRFAEARAACEKALAIYDDECRGVAWHRTAVENYRLSALAFLGELALLADRRREALARAKERGDAFGAAIFQIGQLNLTRLAEDDPASAITDADAVTATWPLRRYHHTIITVQAELYRGAPRAARDRIEAAWAELRHEGLLRLELPRVELLHLRAQTVLSEGAAGLLRASADRLAVRASLHRLAQSEIPPAAPFVAAMRAGLAHREGGAKVEVAARLAEAARGYDAAYMRAHAAACRAGSGLFERDADRVARELTALAALGARRPARFARMVLPWLPEEGLERAAEQVHR